MRPTVDKFVRANIARMEGYASGEQPDDPSVTKLNTNENPWPPSPLVEQTLRTFNISDLRKYPPATALPFRSVAAKLHNVSPDNIIATRGGDELLRLVVTTFVEPGQKIALTEPTYSLYPVLSNIQNCPNHIIPLLDNWQLPDDFPDQVNHSGARITMLVNPGAPTGKLLDLSVISRLCSSLDGLLLLDEAYIDFVDPDLNYDAVPLIAEHDNLIILRTLSKGYSLAGLRFGYGIASANLIAPMLHKTRDSYNMDTIAQDLGVAALQSRDYAATTWARVREERARLQRGLTRLGFEAPNSETNFLLVTVPEEAGVNAHDLYQYLKSKKVVVRYFDSPRLDNKLRITIGTTQQNDELLRVLANR